MTPKASLIYTKSEGKVRKARDDNGTRRQDWQVRCVPNLFPAFTADEKKGIVDKKRIVEDDMFTSMDTLGHHEVIIESPYHDQHPHTASGSRYNLVIEAVPLQKIVDFYGLSIFPFSYTSIGVL